MMRKLLIHQSSTIHDGLIQLSSIEEDISRLILFVIDDEERVIGSLTDGDIR